MKKYKYILVNGYTSTGSSAAIDLLKEYKGVYAPNKEFRIIKDPHGVYDLDKALNNSSDLLNEDIAVREFLWMIHKYSKSSAGFRTFGLDYKSDFGQEIEKISIDYINELTDYIYDGFWWYLDLDKDLIKCLIQKILKKIGIYDYRKHSQMRLFLKKEEDFLDITKKYMDRIFEGLNLDDEVNTIVLDQAIPATHPGLANRYFQNAKVVNIERDPRSVYVDLVTEERRFGYIVGHVGLDIAKTHNIELFESWFRKCRKKGISGDSISINFEDLVLHYDKTVERLEKYVDLDSSLHEKKYDYLKPSVSAENVKYWEKYGDEFLEDIKKIEYLLPEYLYSEF